MTDMLGAPALSILHSLGILALVAVGIAMLQPSRFGEAQTWRRSLLMGGVFGATASLVMLDPVVLAPGATFDARGGPALLAGIYGGPLAALVAAILGSATRLWIGGAGALGGVIGFVIYAAVGTLAGVWLARRGRRPTILWLLGFSLLGTVAVLPTFFAYPDWQTGISVLSHAWWMVLACNVVGTLVLGTLLEQDYRRRRLERDLRETEARTRVAADTKTRFLAVMSHEIRTPMNAVVGFVDLLRDSQLDSFQRRCTDQIRDAAQGLLRIIDDLLDYSKIEAGRLTIEPSPTDVAALIGGCRALLMPQVVNKRIACTLAIDESVPDRLVLDPVRLRQVLLNLLGNAVKFTDHGSVSVSARYCAAQDGAGSLEITVADTGIGIPAEERAQLFSPFTQGGHVGRGGTGLGLVISRMLVDAMAGTIELDSAENQGTTAVIRLPAVVPAPVGATGELLDRAQSPATGLRILVAEDVALNAEMLDATLTQAGHSVRVVRDGRAAVDAVAEEPFDIVLMDVQMPAMDGLAATRAIRGLADARAAVPIVALTAYASREDLKECLDAGMNDFLTKPLERAKLFETLRRLATGAAEAPAVTVDGVDADGVDRVGELLGRLAQVDRRDREAIRQTAQHLTAVSVGIGFDALADRARRLTAAALNANAEALGALIEEVADAGRRAVEGFRRNDRPIEPRQAAGY